MINVKQKIKLVLTISLLLLISCENQNNNSLFYFDVMGDTKLETISIKKNKDKSTFDISILSKNKDMSIVSILPYWDAKYILTNPKIENIYLEANNIQTNEKGLRIIIRNTDLIPDCLYFDLSYKNQWYINRYGVINTNSKDTLYIKDKIMNKSLISEFGNDKICNPKLIYNLYFDNKK